MTKQTLLEDQSVGLSTAAKAGATVFGALVALVLALLSMGASSAERRLDTAERAINTLTTGAAVDNERFNAIRASLERLEKAAGTKP